MPRPAPATPQPKPQITQLGHLEVGPCTVSAITRRWRDGDERRCRLCPAGKCTVFKGSCTVLVSARITADEAELFTMDPLAHGAGPFLRVIADDDGAGSTHRTTPAP